MKISIIANIDVGSVRADSQLYSSHMIISIIANIDVASVRADSQLGPLDMKITHHT